MLLCSCALFLLLIPAGGMLTADNTINVLDSPFASLCIHDDLQNDVKRNQGKAALRTTQRVNSTNSSSSAAGASHEGSSPKAATEDFDNGSVANILESPFVSLMSQDLKKLEEELASAAAAEELASATAAVNINTNK